MFIPEFTFHRPASIEDACRALAELDDAAPLAGGTDLLVEMKQGRRRHRDIVSLQRIAELRAIEMSADTLAIGACATHNAVCASAAVRDAFPAIAQAAGAIGTDQVRNAGTIGGNLCTGASCCDMGPILLALDAEAVIAGPETTRRVPLDEFFVDHHATCLRKGELLEKIIVRRNSRTVATWYEKYGQREAASIAVASVAVALNLEGDMIAEARIVTGAVAPVPRLSREASAVLTGRPRAALSAGSPLLAEAGRAAAADALPIDDLRGSAEFRRTLIRVLTERAVLRALGHARR